MRALCSLVCTLVIGCCVIAPASAQESRKEWRISSPGGQSTVYSTQQEAVAAIKGLPAPPGVPPEARDGWNAVDKIKSQRITFDGKTDITYWMGKAQPSDPEWGYMVSYGTQKYASEDQMVTAYNATWQPNPFCAGETVAPSGAWTPAFPGFEGFENRTYERVVPRVTIPSTIPASTSRSNTHSRARAGSIVPSATHSGRTKKRPV